MILYVHIVNFEHRHLSILVILYKLRCSMFTEHTQNVHVYRILQVIK